MSTREKRTQRDYTLAFKLSVVDQVEKGQMSYKQAQHYYGIQGRSTVLVWCRKHGQLDWRPREEARSRRRCCMFPDIPLTPEQRIKKLETELKDQRMRADFFEAVVKVLETDYGLPIPKKPLGKSLKKSKSKA